MKSVTLDGVNFHATRKGKECKKSLHIQMPYTHILPFKPLLSSCPRGENLGCQTAEVLEQVEVLTAQLCEKDSVLKDWAEFWIRQGEI